MLVLELNLKYKHTACKCRLCYCVKSLGCEHVVPPGKDQDSKIVISAASCVLSLPLPSSLAQVQRAKLWMGFSATKLTAGRRCRASGLPPLPDPGVPVAPVVSHTSAHLPAAEFSPDFKRL